MLTSEQKAARRLGGSIIAAAVGLSRYKTPLDAYLDVRHEAPEVESTEAMDRGTFLEPGIRAWAGKKLGTTWEVPDMPLVHPANNWFTYSPDGLDATRLLECKAPGDFTASEWGKQEEGQELLPGMVPQEYVFQVAWGLMITEREHGVFAAPIGGELRIYRMKRDRDLEAKLVDRATAFINNHVIPGIPPPAQFGDVETIKRLYPKQERQALEWDSLNSFQREVVEQYLEFHWIEKQATSAKESKQVLVQDIIKDAGGIKGLPAKTKYERIDWNVSKPAMHAGSWKALAEELLGALPVEEQKKLKLKHTPAVGSRPFTPRAI